MTLSVDPSTAGTPGIDLAPSRANPPDLDDLLTRMKAAQIKSGAPGYSQRMAHLDSLERVLLKYKDALTDAISQDFGHRSRVETLGCEVFVLVSCIRYCREHLREWMLPQSRHVASVFLPGRAEIMFQPLGVVGIVAPWNYPLQLALAPLTAALAAGNRAMIKPSEFVPRTSELLDKMMREAFDPLHVTVIQGGPEVGQAFTRLHFDHLVFTGSTAVGRLVMKAASENLTPVTLELGGKSPTIVGPGYPIASAAKRIMYGKLLNAGQTCIAPDYVFVPKASLDNFVSACREATVGMFPTLKDNPDYTSVINDRHYKRLQGLLDDARSKGATLVELNPSSETLDPAQRKLCPTLVLGATDAMTVMKEEIFGPILPVLPYDNIREVVDYVNAHPRPLALYYFDNDASRVDQMLQNTTSGSVCINDVIFQFPQDDLPFGGVGDSGMGAYHGIEGFETFSHKKPIFHQSRLSGTPLFRPPYGRVIDSILKFLIG